MVGSGRSCLSLAYGEHRFNRTRFSIPTSPSYKKGGMIICNIRLGDGFMNFPRNSISLALGSLAIVKVSGRPPLAFLGANSAGLEKGSVEGSPNICLPVLSVLLGPWCKFRWPRKRFSGLCGRFP